MIWPEAEVNTLSLAEGSVALTQNSWTANMRIPFHA